MRQLKADEGLRPDLPTAAERETIKALSKEVCRLIRRDLIVIDDIGVLPVAPLAAEVLFGIVDADLAIETRGRAMPPNGLAKALARRERSDSS